MDKEWKKELEEIEKERVNMEVEREFGGKCFNCGKGMIHQWQNHDWGGYSFGACPWCGYVDSNMEEMLWYTSISEENDKREERDEKDVLKECIICDWKEIKKILHCNSREEIIEKHEIKEYYTEEYKINDIIYDAKMKNLKEIQEVVEELKKDNLI